MSIHHPAWEPFRPTSDDPWDLRKVAHLHRRAGFSANWAKLQRDVADGPDTAVSRLLDPEPTETAELQSILSGLRQGILTGPDRHDRLQAYWLYRILLDPDALRENMTLFWHNHFATSNAKVRKETLMLEQNDLLRAHALGDFSTLLERVLTDPAMLIWLDGANSPKERPNENLAREFFELFTLGVGNYTEEDIREAARALTGWVQDARSYGTPDFQFDPHQFDDGRKTFLGSSGNWERKDIVEITLQQPSCAEFICRKLYRHFVCDRHEPAPELIELLAHAFRTSDYSIGHVVEVILRSRHFYSTEVHRQRIASPVELSVHLLRALDVPRADVRLLPLAETCKLQGQELFYPPSVAGWAAGRRWITSTSVVERSNWLSDVIWGNPQLDLPPFDPHAWTDRYDIAPSDAGEAFIDLLLQGDLSPEARDLVLATARPADPDSLRKAAQILVHCPEYQLI